MDTLKSKEKKIIRQSIDDTGCYGKTLTCAPNATYLENRFNVSLKVAKKLLKEIKLYSVNSDDSSDDTLDEINRKQKTIPVKIMHYSGLISIDNKFTKSTIVRDVKRYILTNYNDTYNSIKDISLRVRNKEMNNYVCNYIGIFMY